MSRFPMLASPIGWYQVAYSDELAKGCVMPLHYFDQELVLYRGEDGKAVVLDAHCPHLGAHLGHGGQVMGSDIRCPFHGWSFGGDGACTAIPYAGKIPPKARLTAWPLREQMGMILVHYHPSRAEPAWEPPRLEEYGSSDWSADWVRKSWTIRTHVQEIAENIVDGAHFSMVHKSASMPVTRAVADGHRLRSASRMSQHTPRGAVETTIDGEAHGLGLWVLRFGGIVDTVFIDASTPIDDERVAVRLSFLVSRARGGTAESGVGKALIEDVCKQVGEDIPIWEHKLYRTAPALCSEDAPIATLRNWARQFYETASGGSSPR